MYVSDALLGSIEITRCIITQLEYMSSIIDDLLFSRWRGPIKQPLVNLQKQNQEALDKICKKIYLSSDAAVLSSTPQAIELSNKHVIQDQQYCVRMRLQRKGRGWRVEAQLLKNALYNKVSSRQNQILLLKKISNFQCQNMKESTIYIHLGNIVMVHEFVICLGQSLDQHKLSDFYNVVLQRNLNQFNHFIERYLERPSSIVSPLGSDKTMAQDLLLSQILSTTANCLSLSEESAQFRSAQLLQQEKKEDLCKLKINIVEEYSLEKSGKLYNIIVSQASASWIKNNFQQAEMSNQKRFSSLLAQSKFSGSKKIDDYIFNTVKAVIRELVPKPVNEGGSCLIYIAKAIITFISSVDSSAYVQNEDRKERLIAIKKLKPEFQKKFAHKLQHQKDIVTKLKGGCSYFIPKYYRAELEQDPQDSLMMEYIQGQELDYFTMIRNETISLWTKIFVLLNMVHGLRHLTTYGIVHLDLKPINILVCRQQTTKIIDYGEAFHEDVCSKNPSYSPGYTFPYVSPEVLVYTEQDPEKRQPISCTEKQDVFAFGMIMAELIFNSKVFFFNQAKYKEVYSRKEVLERYFLSPQRLEHYGDRRVMPTLGHLILQCLDNDPQKRPKFDWIAVTLKLILSSCSG